MNKKAQEVGMGGIIMIFIALIVGLALISSIINPVASLTNTLSNVDESVTLPANGSSINLDGQAIVDGTFTAVNSTDGTIIDAGNYTVSDDQIVDGDFTATLTIIDPAYAGSAASLNYTYEPYGYNRSGAARGIARIIPLFFAFILLAAALVGIRGWLKN